MAKTDVFTKTADTADTADKAPKAPKVKGVRMQVNARHSVDTVDGTFVGPLDTFMAYGTPEVRRPKRIVIPARSADEEADKLVAAGVATRCTKVVVKA